MIQKFALIKILTALLEATEEVSLRGLSRTAKVSASTAKYCLDYLEENKLLRKRHIGKLSLYTMNPDSVLLRQIKILKSVAEIEHSRLVQEIRSRVPQTLSISLFGSVAQGTDTPASDIDLLIIVRKKTSLPPFSAEKKIKRELAPLCYTLAEWRDKARTDKAFYEGVVYNAISLFGEKPVVT